MKILCSDLEGTLAPEIWQEIGKEFKISELDLTTRDIPDFDKLMTTRMSALQKKRISYDVLLKFLDDIDPFDGAKDFLDSLKNHYQIIIVSDTFYELCMPVIKKLGNHPIFCHHLKIDNGFIVDYEKRQEEPKKNVVKGLQSMNFECFCIGDSYNDIQMIDQSSGAFIFA
ncbi:MAG: bifunctional phosphoserine phosphatase/homoserine phosphotransferase ThrH, partial [Gammaproteobacteria bacterium]|nr:bifunctional phosphoserine phosphatase/homoserine phosphotransferase ThrH [Gammaproteobacteria bacterium]